MGEEVAMPELRSENYIQSDSRGNRVRDVWEGNLMTKFDIVYWSIAGGMVFMGVLIIVGIL